MRKTDAKAIIPPGMETMTRDWKMSPGVMSGNHLFLTGFNGCPMDGPPPDDPRAQIEIAFETVGQVLAEAALDWGNVVDMTSFHIGLRDHLELFKSVRANYVRAPYPAWTAIEVAGFATAGVIIELKVTARLRRHGRS